MFCPVPARTGRVPSLPVLVSMTTSLRSGVKVKSSSQEGGTLRGTFTAFFFFPRKKERMEIANTDLHCCATLKPLPQSQDCSFSLGAANNKGHKCLIPLGANVPVYFSPRAMRAVHHPWDRSTTNPALMSATALGFAKPGKKYPNSVITLLNG